MNMSLFEVVAKRSGASVILTHSITNPIILYSNKEHNFLTGYKDFELIGKSPKIFQGKNTDISTTKKMKESLMEIGFWCGDITNYTKNGTEMNINLLIFSVIFSDTKYFIVYKKEKGSKFLSLVRKVVFKLIHYRR